MDHERMRMLQSEFEARYNPLNYNAIHEPKKLSIEKRNFDFLNQQYVKDQEWKDAKAFYNGSINLLERSVLGTLAMARDYNIATRREREPNYQPMAEGVAIIDEVLNSEHLKPFNVKGDTVAEQFRLDLVQGAGQLATQAAATILTGGAAGTALMGAQIAGNQYLDLKEAGVDTKRAAQASIANAIIQTPLERLSLGKLLKRVPAGSTLGKKLKQIGESALTEAFTEGIQQYPEEITNMIAKNEGKTIRELAVEFDKNVGTYTKNALYAGLIGGILGGGASSIRVALERNVHKEQLNTLEERIDNVKKSGADPTYAASVINANLQGETIQIDGEILYGYAQTQNIEELANSLGITQEEIVSAVDSGSTIDILRGNFEATAAQKPDFYSAVKDSVTFEDGGYSINNEHLQKEIAKEYQKVKYNLDEFENWKTEKINELRQSGATKQETLQTIVLMESAARTQYPDDPMQYFRDNPVSFKRVVSTSDGRYMQTKSANEKLLEDENNFAGIVDEYTNGKINPDKAYNVMTTPLALGLAGGKILPVTIDGNKIQHIFDGHSDGMTPELLKQIPRAMANPMMVLDSYGGRKVVVLDLKDKQGSTIIVPLELNVERNRYQVNAINNAYGKGSENGTDYNWFIEHNLKKGRVSYINKEKTAKWLQSSSSDSASKGNDLDSLLNNSIPDENALRKRREEMQGYYQTAFHGSSHRFEKFDLSVGRKASETLNKYGIEGISYHGLKDGRCFVVFDDQAIKIINSYNQKVNNDKKGEIKWDEEGKAIITMFEGADVSTVIHEAMGHYLSVNIMRQSKLPTATEQQRKDRQTLLEYAETSEEEWAELDKYDGYLTKEQFERKTAIYERWATGAEQYFMLGVAPNKELRRIFANCKKWLLGIYKSIRDFVAANKYAKEITPEVQAVFDRALASEEAIREQQKLDGYFAKLPDTILDNLSETSKRRLEAIIENAYDKAVESLTKESLKNFTKERRTEINAYRDKIAPTITESIQTERLYITGRQMTETLGEKSAATSAQKYQDLIGRAKNPEEVLTDKEQEYMLLFSAVAEQNGYASGEDFAKAVLENPTEAQAIENAIDKVVDEKFPDIVNERQAAELATKEAFYNDESGLVLGIEQQIIEDAAVGLLAKQRSTEAKMKLAKARRQQAKNAAVKMIDGMSIKDAVRVQKFIVAERNAAAKAAVAVRDGDMETALTQKRLQALNHALVMESMKTRLAVDKAGRALKRAKNAKKETWFNDNHLSQAGALFARMGIKLKGYDPENKKMTLGQYVNAMNELLGNADIAEWLFDETVDISNPTALTRQQYFDVVDAIKNIRALAKQEKGVDLLETKKDFNEFKTETLTRLQDLKTVEKLAPGEKAKINLIRKGIAQGLTSDSIYEILDKGKQGFFYNNLYLPLKHKLDLESVDLAYLTKWFETASKNWKEAVGDVYAKASYSELGVDIDGEPLKIDRTNLVKMLVYSGTQDSFRRLCDTPPVGLENSPLWVRASDTVSDEAARQATAENILSFLSNNLTSHDVVMAQELINIAEYKWSEKAENEQQTKGFAPKKQEATPRELVLADGNTVIFRGGYFPLVRDTRGGSTPTGNTPFTETNEPQLKYGMHTNTGSMKARTVGAKYPVDLTLDAGMREINASIHDLHFRKVIQGANRIFNDKDITSLMRAKLGTATFKALKEQIEVTARPEGMYNTSAAESFIGDIADKLRGKVIPYMIGMSLKINTQNLANIALYGNNVEGYGHIEALQDFITNGIMLGINSPRAAREMWKTVQELSPMMAERFKGTDFTARELMEKNKFDGVTKKVLEWSNMSMAFTDGLTAMPIWYGAYTRQMNTGKTQQEAIDYADSIIRKTMGSTRATDVSSMVRAKGATKIFFMFQTFFNTQFNQWYTTFKHQELNLSDKEYKKIAKEVSSFVFAKWATFTLFSLLLAGENPFVDDDDDDYNDFLSELFSYPFTLGGPIGQGVNFGVRRMFDMQTFPYRISPIESSLNTVFTSTSTIGKVVRGEKENEELVEPVVNLALLAKGLPSQLSKWFFNAWDILYNDMDPRVDDLFRRRPKREREE